MLRICHFTKPASAVRGRVEETPQEPRTKEQGPSTLQSHRIQSPLLFLWPSSLLPLQWVP